MDRLPRALLGVEGGVAFLAATVLYFHGDHPWWLFLVLVLAPDLAMVGYVAGARAGAVAYDAVHTYALPVALAAAGVIWDARHARRRRPDLDRPHRRRPRDRLRVEVPERLQGHAPAARLVEAALGRFEALVRQRLDRIGCTVDERPRRPPRARTARARSRPPAGDRRARGGRRRRERAGTRPSRAPAGSSAARCAPRARRRVAPGCGRPRGRPRRGRRRSARPGA